MVDLIYEARDWKSEDGSYREAYEKYGLQDVADEMEKLGYLPKRPAQRWHDYGEPPVIRFVEYCRQEAGA